MSVARESRPATAPVVGSVTAAAGLEREPGSPARPSLITPREATALGAIVAGAVATIPAMTSLWTDPRETPFTSAVTLSLIGGAIVVPLGGWLGPNALGSRLQAMRTVGLMTLIPVVLGAFVWAFGWMVKAVAEGNANPIEVVPGALVIGALGAVLLGWLYVVLLTLPSALAWVAILRAIGWVVGRRRKRRAAAAG